MEDRSDKLQGNLVVNGRRLITDNVTASESACFVFIVVVFMLQIYNTIFFTKSAKIKLLGKNLYAVYIHKILHVFEMFISSLRPKV